MKKRTGFTLMELLVVIAIIALVIAILLPILKRAGRPAQVLASPVAYLAYPGGRLYVADARGLGKLEVYSAKGDWPQGGVTWSPSGQRIAFRTTWADSKNAPLRSEIVIVNPFSGQYRTVPLSQQNWLGWVDSGHIALTGSAWGMQVVDIESGEVEREVHPSGDGGVYEVTWFSPLPQGKQYVAGATYWRGGKWKGNVIAVLRSDLSVGKIVWDSRSAPPGSVGAGWQAFVDPSGEWVAWGTEISDGKGSKTVVALKAIGDPTSRLPTVLDPNEAIPGSTTGILCDWTEDGNLLLNVWYQAESVTRLAVIGRTGRLLRVLPITDVGPNMIGSVAWRKYYHQ